MPWKGNWPLTDIFATEVLVTVMGMEKKWLRRSFTRESKAVM